MLPHHFHFSLAACVLFVFSILSIVSLSFFSHFILIWLFADQRVTRVSVPASSACKIFIAICISHLAFAICDLWICIWMLLACELWIIHSFTRCCCCCCCWWFKYRFALICISIALFRHFTMDYFAVASTECDALPLNAMWFIYGCISSAFAVVVVWQIMRPLFVIVCI